MIRPNRPSLAVALLTGAILLAGCGGGGTPPSKPFEPRASLRAIGGTARTDKPAFLLRVAFRPGDENVKSVAVTLPPVVLVDPNALSDVCGRRELRAKRCAGHDPLGFASAVTPILAKPLSGPVYVTSGYGQELHLAYVLHGPPDLLLGGRIVPKGGRMQAGVEDVPNQPLKTFELKISGGKTGDLMLSRDICAAKATADAAFTSQEGQVHEEQIPLLAGCG